MDHATKAKLILALHKHSLQAMSVGGAVTGGLSGAATGAAIGSVVPGIGTAIGAGVGGLLGLVGGGSGGDDDKKPQGVPAVNPIGGAQMSQAQGNVQDAYGAQRGLTGQLAGQNGIANQSNVFNAYGQIASGQGPNPAQAALNQATGANVANQAALMAGQRGASANAGLIARQAAQQGGALQQQAAGQGATLQAQQQLAALGAQSGIAQNQVGNLMGATENLGNQALANQGQAYNMIGNVNSTNAGMQGNVNNNNIGQQQIDNQRLGAIAGAGSAAAGLIGHGSKPENSNGSQFAGGPMDAGSFQPMTLAAAHGGMIPKMATGGDIGGPQSFVGQWLQEAMGGKIAPKLAAEGGSVKTTAPDQKASKKDNSYDNDKVPAMLSEGEIVIPRSITTHPMAAEKAAAFVQAALNKRRMSARA